VGFIKPCKHPVNNGINYLCTGAGFLVAKVCFFGRWFFHKIKTAAWAYTLENEDFEPSTWINMEV